MGERLCDELILNLGRSACSSAPKLVVVKRMELPIEWACLGFQGTLTSGSAEEQDPIHPWNIRVQPPIALLFAITFTHAATRHTSKAIHSKRARSWPAELSQRISFAKVSHRSEVPSVKDESTYNPYLPSLRKQESLEFDRDAQAESHPPPNET